MAEYRTVQGDTWDIIAKRVYGSEKYLDYLMVNNFDLLDYLIFPAGVIVRVMELPKTVSEELPAWRKQ